MNSKIYPTPRFEIIDNKTLAYQEYQTLYKCLERLFWISDNLLTGLNQNVKGRELTLYQLIVLSHLIWLCGQIRGILLLLNEALVSQAQQLIRTLWEAKVNLLYISKRPEERALLFNDKVAEEFEALRSEADKDNPNIPTSLKGLPRIVDIKKPIPEIWNDRIIERAKEVGLEDEYRTVYKIYSWASHVAPPSVICGYVKIDEKNIGFDPNESLEQIPAHLVVAIGFSFQIFIEISTVLNLLSQLELETLNREITTTLNHFVKTNKKYVDEVLPQIVIKFSEQQKAQ